ncbi:MAG TPA: hypothetical protein VG245_08130 [Candidatus Dormibacteraeota bacterium]|nr:hypothetical protein [Candidatus Dormibacteraeota bacterium]
MTLARLLTQGIPHAGEAWLVLPLLVSWAAALLLAATVARQAGGWAGLVALIALVAVAPVVLNTYVDDNFHVTTWLSLALLGAAAYWWARGRARGPAVVAGLAAVIGVNLASDALLLVFGLLPLLGTVALRRSPARARLLVVAAGATVLAAAVVAGETWWGFSFWRIGQGSAVDLAVLPRAVRAGDNVASFLAGAGPAWLGSWAPAGRGALSVIAVVGVTWYFGRTLVVAGRADMAAADGNEPGIAWLTFWSLCGLSTLALFTLTGLGGPGAGRYLVPILLALAATVPLRLGRRPGLAPALLLAVAAVAAGNAAALPAMARDLAPAHQRAARIVALLTANGLTHGYAGYDEALPVVWLSGGRIESRQVQQGRSCQDARPGSLCRGDRNFSSAWYRPLPGPSFVIADTDPCVCLRGQPGAWFGTPTAVYRSGTLTVYVYDHDVAAEIADR